MNEVLHKVSLGIPDLVYFTPIQLEMCRDVCTAFIYFRKAFASVHAT